MHEAKKKERISSAPQITQLFGEKYFRTKLNFKGRKAWKAFENFSRNFLVNEKDENYSEIVQDLISSQSAMGCNMSLSHQFSHLDFFLKIWQPSPRDMAKFSITIFPKLKKGYSGKWIPDMLAKYCCSLIRGTQTDENNKHKKAK